MNDNDNFQEIKTELDKNYAIVNFIVDGTAFRLRKSRDMLNHSPGIWGVYPTITVCGMEILFPAAKTKFEIKKLRELWSSLVEQDFESY
jgi:hypothetical protein